MWEFGVKSPKLSKSDVKRAKKKGYVEIGEFKRKPTEAQRRAAAKKRAASEARKKAASRRKTKKLTKRVYRKLF